MRLQISARHAEVPQDVKTIAEEKVRRLGRYFDHVIQAQLILSPDFKARRGSNDHGARRAEEAGEGGEKVPTSRAEKSEDTHGHVATAELLLTVPHEHKPLVAHAVGESFRSAIDIVVDKMDRQLRKYKGKLRRRRQRRTTRSDRQEGTETG